MGVVAKEAVGRGELMGGRIEHLRHWCLLLVLVTAGCATTSSTVGPGEPAAEIHDSGHYIDPDPFKGSSMATVFAATEVDGRPIDNSFRHTRGADWPRFTTLTLGNVVRPLPAKVIKLRLVGDVVYSAPILGLVNRQNLRRVEGEVVVEPRPNVRYAVKGELGAERSTIWVEESLSGKRVSEVVSAP